MAKFDKQLSCKNIFFNMTLFLVHAHYICTVLCAKYQKSSVYALVQVYFLMYPLSKHRHNPYLIGNRKKWLSSQSYHLSKINILASKFLTQMFNVSILYKQSIRLFHQKLWYKLISPHMHYVCINKTH